MARLLVLELNKWKVKVINNVSNIIIKNFAFTFGFAAQVRAFGLNKDFIDTQIIYVDFEAGMMRIDAEISFAPITDIPVSVITKSSGHGTDYVIEEFFNWNHGSKAIPINRYAIKKQ